MAQFFSTLGRHLECAIQTELVVELELALIERKQCRRFRHNSIICQEDTIYRVQVTSCNVCARAKLKGHRELIIEQSPSLVQ